MTLPAMRRDEFRVLERLTYLNTASIGLVPPSVVDAAHRFEAEVAGAGTTGMDEDTEAGILEDARAAAAQLVGAAPDTVGITTSFTEGLCQVAWWLRPGAGRNVVSTDIEFPAVTYPWHRLAEDTGCEVRLVGALEDPGRFGVEAIAAAVDGATAAVCVSHVEYLTGHLLDLGELATIAHEHGALLVVDATQSAGQVPIDVGSSGVDVLIAGSYKWLCSTFGAGFCYLSPTVLRTFRPPFAGWRSVADPWELDAHWRPLAPGARQLEYSTMSYAAAVAFGRAIRYVSGLSVADVASHNRALAAELADGLEERGARLLTPHDPSPRTGIVTARFGGVDGEEVAAALTRRGIVVSPRVGSTRFSLHFYNDSADVARALAVLDDVLDDLG